MAYGILKDLHNFGLKGRLPNFIESFLEDRTIQVRIGSTLSDLYDQGQGVPQGAYDTTWRYGILKDLHNFGLKGRLSNFIKSFLEDRTIQVRVGSTLSDRYDQVQGVPQGAILSTTLFI